jgi:hypothetical protein
VMRFDAEGDVRYSWDAGVTFGEGVDIEHGGPIEVYYIAMERRAAHLRSWLGTEPRA